MRLRAASAERITTTSGAVCGPVLAALPLGALAVVPLLAASSLRSAFTACALFLLAASCLYVGRLWPAPVELLPGRRQLLRRGRRVSFDEIDSLVLTAALGSPAESYEVRVRLRDGANWPLLSGLDPAHVLRELGRLVSLTGLPVERGWGMPKDASPWLEVASEAPLDPAGGRLGGSPLGWGVHSSQPLVSLSMKIATALTAMIMGVFIAVRLVEGKGIGALSVALALGLVLVLLGVAAAVALERVQLQGDGTLFVTMRSWGLTRKRAAIARSDLIRVYAVQAVTHRHLLIETRGGPIAVPFGAPGPVKLMLEGATSTRAAS